MAGWGKTGNIKGPPGTTGLTSRTSRLTVQNTVADQQVISLGIFANALVAGQTFRITAAGDLSTPSGYTGSLTLRAKIGALICTVQALPGASKNGQGWRATFDVVVRTIGASGTVALIGQVATTTVIPTQGPVVAGALNTTVALTLELALTWSVANNNAVARCDVAYIELIKN